MRNLDSATSQLEAFCVVAFVPCGMLWIGYARNPRRNHGHNPFSIGYDPRRPYFDSVEEFPHFSPLTWTNPRLSLLSCSADQGFCSFGSTTVTPSSSNLFYIV